MLRRLEILRASTCYFRSNIQNGRTDELMGGATFQFVDPASQILRGKLQPFEKGEDPFVHFAFFVCR